MKILSILVVLAMVCAVLPMVVATESGLPTNEPNSQPYGPLDVTTTATIGGGNTGGNSPPQIIAKWDYDMTTVRTLDPVHPDACLLHDADYHTSGLQVKPVLAGDVTVRVYAVVYDPDGVDTISHVYADTWHPDGKFKYQKTLSVVSDDPNGVPINALAAWDHVVGYHPDLLTKGVSDDNSVIREMISQSIYKVYWCDELINYCQPGGWYLVGIRATDTYNTWSTWLYNHFWYIPTSAIQIDFSTVNYGTVPIPSANPKWIPGDTIMDQSGQSQFPTVRNIGNTPVDLYVWQNDMGFGMTDGQYDVSFDARLGHHGVNGDVSYGPSTVYNGNNYGIRIPGVLPLCTEDKLDFSIHAYKGDPGVTKTGQMKLTAFIDCASYVAHGAYNFGWDTPENFHQIPNNGIDPNAQPQYIPDGVPIP